MNENFNNVLLKEIFQKITVVIGIGTFSSLKIGYNLRL